jgi:hypothetical protein
VGDDGAHNFLSLQIRPVERSGGKMPEKAGANKLAPRRPLV